VNWYCID